MNTVDRPQTLIAVGLGLSDNECKVMSVGSMVTPRPDRKHTLMVVATLKDADSFSIIMKRKSMLKDKPQFTKVFID